MDQSRYEVAPGIWLDARRALWLSDSRVLAVADLHLGYAWAHRHGGQLLPLSMPDDTSERLMALQESYRADHVVLLGDIVHRAVPLAPIQKDLTRLLGCFPAATEVSLVAGNHDRHPGHLLAGHAAQLKTHVEVGNCIFLHGDAAGAAEIEQKLREAQKKGFWAVIGHEHPACTLGDGVATWQKYPCFLVCDGLLVLPAFSRWAAGNSRDEYMSPLLDCNSVKAKIAILGDRLVPLRVS